MDPSPSAAKRLWHIVRVVYYMLRKGISKHKFVMELNLLLKRGKLAGKAIGNLLAHHHHHHHRQHQQQYANISGGYSSFSCRSMDPNLSFYDPKEVQFSCSNTPVYPSFAATNRKNYRRHDEEDYHVAAIAKAFEILNSEASTSADESSVVASPSPSPSPLLWTFGRRTPAAVRQLRITDSPFPLREEEEGGELGDGRVDEEAEVFIRRFYEQLRLQQRAPETPDYSYYQRETTPLSAGRGRRVG